MDIKCDVMVNWLHARQLENMWSSGSIEEGVVLKKAKDLYSSCPAELSMIRGQLFDAVQHLNVKVAVYRAPSLVSKAY